MLVDTGPRYTAQSDAGSRIIAPYLRQRGIDRLDLMVVSHLDSDHSGGAASVMKEVAVDRLLTSVDPASPSIRGARRTERCEHGMRGTLGPATWNLLQPAADDYLRRLDTNSMSCVIALDFAEHRVVLTGDVPAAREEQILAREAAGTSSPVTLLIASHHGSRSSSGEPWVRALRPRWVAYTVGYRNRFGHPHPEVVQRLGDAGAKAVRTDESGTTTWRLRRGGDVTVARSRVDQARYWHNRPGTAPQPIGAELVRDDGAETVVREPASPEPY